MCGIAGIAALAGAPAPGLERLKMQCNTLVHRGPDGEGIGLCDGVGLAMRRLAIIDVDGGHQPIANEDGTVRVVFNGEIFNFRELRRELEGRGHRFATRSDTEVIVHAYEEYGVDCVTRLNGQFAFALHDQRRRRLLLARDHLGVKPLFYAHVPPYLVWGSEIKALLASGLVPRELDVDALAQFLAWEYVPGEATLLGAVRKLRPGHVLDVGLDDGGAPVPREFWDVPETPEDQDTDEAAWLEAVDAKITECVRRQLVSDVPLGAFLSGGVDSSLVVAAMGRSTTFGIGFEDSSYNELPFAREVARHLGLEHHDRVVSPDVVDLFPRLMRYMDDPIADFSIFPTYMVAALARERVTVALSGDGGDELFGGYETYVAEQMATTYGRLPGALRGALVEPLIRSLPPRPQKKGLINKAKRFVEGLAHPAELGHARWRLFLGDMQRATLLTEDARAAVTRPASAHIAEAAQRAVRRGPVNRSLYVDLKSYLCDEMLVKVDRMTMANSLEARVPLLDKELVELVFRIPDRHKLDRGHTKPLLKALARRRVPRECVDRPKEGFSIPIKHWLGGAFRPLLEDLLHPDRLRREGLFEPDEVERLKREHFSGAANHSHNLWAMVVFQAWQDMWLRADLRDVRAA